MEDRERKQVRLDSAGIRHFLETYRTAMDVFEQAGYARFRGTPVGYLLDVPAISDEVSRRLERISKENPGRAWYEAIPHLDDEGVSLTITYPRKVSSGKE